MPAAPRCAPLPFFCPQCGVSAAPQAPTTEASYTPSRLAPRYGEASASGEKWKYWLLSAGAVAVVAAYPLYMRHRPADLNFDGVVAASDAATATTETAAAATAPVAAASIAAAADKLVGPFERSESLCKKADEQNTLSENRIMCTPRFIGFSDGRTEPLRMEDFLGQISFEKVRTLNEWGDDEVNLDTITPPRTRIVYNIYTKEEYSQLESIINRTDR